MREIKVTKNFINSAENSVLYESGNTKVLVTVSHSKVEGQKKFQD